MGLSSLLLPLVLCSGPSIETLDNTRTELRPFLDAIALVESRGRDDAVGDSGKAIGRYQIWRIYWQDAIEYSPEIGGTYENVRSKDYAERIIVAYLLRYAKDDIANQNYEVLSRIHNGGPKGHLKKVTGGYWKRVSKHLIICPFCGRYEFVN